jgi:hypothetical protein
MIEVDQDLQTAGHNLMGFASLDIGHEADATGVVLIAGVVQALRNGSAHPGNPWSQNSEKLPGRDRAEADIDRGISGKAAKGAIGNLFPHSAAALHHAEINCADSGLRGRW